MKLPKITANTDLNRLPGVQKLRLERVNPMLLVIVGAVLLLVMVLMLFIGGSSQQDNEVALNRAQQSLGQVRDLVKGFRRVLEDQQVQELAVMAAAEPDKLPNLQQYLSGRIPDLIEVKLHGPELG